MKKLSEDYTNDTQRLEYLAKDLIGLGLKEGQDFDILYIENVGYHLDIIDEKVENLSVMKLLEQYEVC